MRMRKETPSPINAQAQKRAPIFAFNEKLNSTLENRKLAV
jgi:hypothetical protein